MKLILSDDSVLDLDHRWIPAKVFHYSTAGSVERQEGVTETFFYGDKTPEAHSIDLTYTWNFVSLTQLIQFIGELTNNIEGVQTFVYDEWSIDIDKAYINWGFGNSMSHLQLILHLVPVNNAAWSTYPPIGLM